MRAKPQRIGDHSDRRWRHGRRPDHRRRSTPGSGYSTPAALQAKAKTRVLANVAHWSYAANRAPRQLIPGPRSSVTGRLHRHEIVTCEHDRTGAVLSKLSPRFRGGRLDRIGDGDRSCCALVDVNEDGGTDGTSSGGPTASTDAALKDFYAVSGALAARRHERRQRIVKRGRQVRLCFTIPDVKTPDIVRY